MDHRHRCRLECNVDVVLKRVRVWNTVQEDDGEAARAAAAARGVGGRGAAR